MAWTGKALAAAVAACAIAVAARAAPTQESDINTQFSREALELVERVTRTGDHDRLPFAIVDKKEARIFVFDPDGRLRGVSAALLGQTAGDDSAPDVGEHAQTGEVPLDERTTPAGRFVAEAGRNRGGEHVIWVDYDSAFAIHRVRPGRSRPARVALLESSTPQDRRVSLGCVVVPVRFYEQVVRRWLGQGRSVVYVLPEVPPEAPGLPASASLEEAASAQ